MKIYCRPDIHGCLAEFEEALSIVLEHLEEEDTKLILQGIMYTAVRMAGVLWSGSSIDYMNEMIGEEPEEDDDRYIKWLSLLPKYHVEGNTIFVHVSF